MSEKLIRRREINERLKAIDGELLVAKVMKANDLEEELYEEKRTLLLERTRTY